MSYQFPGIQGCFFFLIDYSEDTQDKKINITRTDLHNVAKKDIFVKMALS